MFDVALDVAGGNRGAARYSITATATAAAYYLLTAYSNQREQFSALSFILLGKCAIGL